MKVLIFDDPSATADPQHPSSAVVSDHPFSPKAGRG
jgi:hypothetical protein